MKKILAGTLLLTSFLFISLSNVSAYELPKEKTDVITKSLDAKTIATLDKLISKWSSQKTYDVYNKISKVVYSLQMKTLQNVNLSEAKKTELIDKYNSVLYSIEKHLDDKYKPTNTVGDSI